MITQNEINKMTKEDILSEECFRAIDDVETPFERRKLVELVGVRAKEFKCCGEFKRLYASYHKDNLPVVQGQNKTDYDWSVPTMLCGEWIANENGVQKLGIGGQIVKACSHPILPLRTLISAQTGKAKTELTFKRRGTWKKIIVDRDVLASANKIVQLANYDVHVTSESAKALVAFLDDVEQANEEDIPEQISTSKLGWTPNGFMPYRTDMVFDGADRSKGVYDAIQTCGSRETWLNIVKNVRQKKQAVTALYLAASFASPLVEKLNLLPFIVNLVSETGSGKTVSLMLAMSVWGDPDKLLTKADTTVTSLELKLDVLNSLPLALDDLSTIMKRFAGEYDDLVYRLCSGSGRARANADLSMRYTASWLNCILTNSERSIVSSGMQGGAVNRVIEIESEDSLFDKNTGNATVNVLRSHFGHLGMEWVDYLNEGGIEAITCAYTDIANELRRRADAEGIIKEEKQLAPMALLMAVDRILEERYFCDGITLDYDFCYGVIKTHDQVSEYQRAYERICDWIRVHAYNFSEKSTREFYGEQQKDGTYAIYSSAFDSICKDCDIDAGGFRKWGAKHGAIVPDAQGKSSRMVRVGGKSGKLTRCVVFVMNDSEIAEFEEIAPEDLPFD